MSAPEKGRMYYIAGLRHAFISAFCTFIVVWEPVSELWSHCYYKCNNLALGVIGTVDIKSLILQLPIKKLHTRLDIIFFYLQVSMCNGDQGKIKSLIVHVHNIWCCMHHLIYGWTVNVRFKFKHHLSQLHHKIIAALSRKFLYPLFVNS